MKQFAGGFVTAAVLVGGAGLWVVKRADTRVRWPVASFYDDGDTRPDSGYIRAQGSLIGEDMTGTTFLDVRCLASERTCRINELSNFGPYRQVMLWDDKYPITSWRADQMVAESSPPPSACHRVTLVMDRVAKVVHYYRIPSPEADKARCAKSFVNRVYDWTLGEQPI